MGGILSSFSGRCFCCTQPAPSPSPGAGAACAVRTPSQQSSAAETLEQPADLEAQHRRGQDSGAGPQFATYMARLEAERRIRRRRRVADAWCSRSVCCSCWAHGASFSWLVGPVLDALSVRGELERLQLKEYYVAITEEYEMRSRRMGWWLYHLRVVRTTFNVVLPAILALQNVGYLSSMIMWLTWTLSLAVSLATAYLDLFRLDDFYEMFTRAAEYLKLEGWQFFGLLGRYAAHDTHQEALPVFMERVAKLRRAIIDQEFPPNRKNGGSGTGGNFGGGGGGGSSGVHHPTVASALFSRSAVTERPARGADEGYLVHYPTQGQQLRQHRDRDRHNTDSSVLHATAQPASGGADGKRGTHSMHARRDAHPHLGGNAARAAAGRTRPPPVFGDLGIDAVPAASSDQRDSRITRDPIDKQRRGTSNGSIAEGAEMTESRNVEGNVDSGILPPLTRNHSRVAADMTQLSVTPQQEQLRDSLV